MKNAVTDRGINNLVEKSFLSNTEDVIQDLNEKMISSSGITQFKIASAYRLVLNWMKYKNNQVSKNDFECSLRNYLLVLNTDIEIRDYQLSDENTYGLRYNYGKIIAKYALPDYVNSTFVKSAFLNGYVQSNNKSRYLIPTSPFVEQLTGYSQYKSVEQQIAVQGAFNVPNGYTALISMLTGGGKSLITQTVSYQFEESLTIIIVPTISLMIDQERSAKATINSDVDNEIYSYYSGCDEKIVLEAIQSRRARMLFISPEALIKNKRIQSAVTEINDCGYLRNLVIDEAHIVVEWGSLFRVDFQCMDAFRKKLMLTNPDLRTFLLSATYSDDTVKQLKMFYSTDNKFIEIRLDKLRKEPRFNVIKASTYTDKQSKSLELIDLLPRPLIVYVKSPSDAENLNQKLVDVGYKNVRTFTGKTSSNERELLINQWVNNEFEVMIATCAFGVGVDKKDVRTVLHLYVPENPNKYYQECGRGGRDGLPCLSVILYTEDDVNSAFQFTQKVLTTEKLEGRWFSMLDSFKTERIVSNDTIRINTSVAPSYRTDDFYIEVSDANIGWNVYVILLLRRRGLITIEQVEIDDSSYIFTVHVIKKEITFKSEETTKIFEEVREEEYKRITDDFFMMKNALKNVHKHCLADMFTKIYSYTEEYCAGCDAHENVQDDESISINIKNLSEPKSKISSNVLSIMESSGELLILLKGRNISDVLKTIIDSGINMLVLSNEFIKKHYPIEINCNNKNLFIMSFDEFLELCSFNNTYFVSGCIAFVIENHSQFNCVHEAIARKKKTKCIYISDEDIYIKYRKKNMSEIVNGPCKFSYVIIEEMNKSVKKDKN